MATSKHRFSITLSPNAEKSLTELCRLMGTTKAGVIESLIRLASDDDNFQSRLSTWVKAADVSSLTTEQKLAMSRALDLMHSQLKSEMGLS